MCNIPDRAELYFEVRIISEPRLDICHIIQKVYSEINDSRENLFFFHDSRPNWLGGEGLGDQARAQALFSFFVVESRAEVAW